MPIQPCLDEGEENWISYQSRHRIPSPAPCLQFQTICIHVSIIKEDTYSQLIQKVHALSNLPLVRTEHQFACTFRLSHSNELTEKQLKCHENTKIAAYDFFLAETSVGSSTKNSDTRRSFAPTYLYLKELPNSITKEYGTIFQFAHVTRRRGSFKGRNVG